MEITIQRRGETLRRQPINRLVSTVGFGDGCDIMLAPGSHTERLGMLIQQGEGLSFRPLNQPSGVFINGVEVAELTDLPSGAECSLMDYVLVWTLEGKEVEREPWAPPAVPVTPVGAGRGYRAGALSAYGSSEQSNSAFEQEGVELELSRHAQQQRDQIQSKTEPKTMSSAEADLLKKLELARQQSSTSTSSSPSTYQPTESTQDEKFWERLPQNDEAYIESTRQLLDEVEPVTSPEAAISRETSLIKSSIAEVSASEASALARSETGNQNVEASNRQEKINSVEAMIAEGRSEALAKGMAMVQRSGRPEDVTKYFFNHLDFEIFTRSSSERRLALIEGLKQAIDVVLGKENSASKGSFSTFEKNLKTSQPLKDLMADDSVMGLMIRDKGLLYVDRGKGFREPEHRFLNAAQAYWVLDRLFLGAGIKMEWKGGQKSFSIDAQWGGRVILPGADWQGAYAIMGRRGAGRTSFSMPKEQRMVLAEKVKRRENILVVAEHPEVLQQLGYWLVKQAESMGNVLVLSRSEPVSSSESPRRIAVQRDEEPLQQWLDWGDGIDLVGTLHRDPVESVFDLIKTLSHQSHGWWQLQLANGPGVALERLSLDMSLEHPEMDPSILRQLLRGAYGGVLSVKGPSISGKKLELTLLELEVPQSEDWFSPPRSLQR